MQYVNISPFNRVSRVPYNGSALKPYIINPSVKELEKRLKETLDNFFEDEEKAIDGQNGNVFDKVIDDWASLAKEYLTRQKEENIDRINVLSNIRIANRDNAEKLIEYETIELERLRSKIDKLNEKIRKNGG